MRIGSVGVRATRAVACLAAVAVTVAAFACGTLPDLGGGCGNSIVDDGEDCDRFASAAGSVCRQPGTAGQCRFDCTEVKDDAGNAIGPKCPAGYRCGNDAICRQPSGTYELFSGAGIASLADSVIIADFDGDKINDILARTRVDLTVYFGDIDGKFGASFPIPAADVSPTAGVLTNPLDLQADLAYGVSNLGGAISVWRGNADRSLTAIPYPEVTIANDPKNPPPPEEPRVLPLEVLSNEPGREIVVFLSSQPGQNLVILKDLTHSFSRAPQDIPLFTLTDKPANIASLVGGSFREDPVTSPCDEFVVAFKAEKAVHVFTPCRGAAPNVEPFQVTLPDVTLALGTVDEGFLVADLNGDGHLDLVIDAVIDPKNPNPLVDPIDVAFGLGDGTFNSTLPLPAPGTQDNLAKQRSEFPIYPLAIGRLTNDNLPDLVTPHSIILLSGGMADAGADAAPLDGGVSTLEIVAPRDILWNEAHILDLNGDGFLDVVAGSDSASIDVYTGGPEGLFDHSSYAAEGATHDFVFGDFDGDGTIDTAFSAKGPLSNTLSIMFGRPRGAPQAPVRLAQFDTIEQVESGVFHTFGRLPADGIADLSVVWRANGTQYISILEGSTDRQIQAPFVLSTNGVTASALGVTFGRFTAGEKIVDSNHADIGAVGRIPGDGTEVSVRFWRSQMVDVARLSTDPNAMSMGGDVETYESDPAKLARGIKQPSHDWSRVQLASMKLDKVGATLDEMVVLAPPSRAGLLSSRGEGTLYVEHVDANVFTDVVKPISLGPDRDDKRGAWQLATVDLDNDGAKEAVVFSDGADATLQVFWNRQNGSFDTASTRVEVPACAIPTPDCHRPIGFAAINADGDPQKELFILTSTGIFSTKSTAPNTFSVPTLVPGFDLDKTNEPDSGAKLVPTFIAAGDVNGDGVDDLVVLFPGSIKVYRGGCKGTGCETRVVR